MDTRIRKIDSDKWYEFKQICRIKKISANQRLKELVNEDIREYKIKQHRLPEYQQI